MPTTTEKIQARIDRLNPPPKYVMAIIAVVLLGIAIFSWRNSAGHGDEDLLFSRAAGRDFHGTEDARAAIKKLASYHDPRSTALLLDIAQGNTIFQFDDLEIQAAKALKGREGVQLSSGLAMILQPHQGLELRKAVADDLLEIYCDHECLRLIMHYLERIWGGEPNFEDHWIRKPDPSTQEEEQKFVQTLLSTLRRESRETTVMLTVTYGLDTVTPAPFALELVKRAGLTVSCPHLLRSSQSLKQLSPEVFRAPRAELQQAIDSLHCGTGH